MMFVEILQEFYWIQPEVHATQSCLGLCGERRMDSCEDWPKGNVKDLASVA